MQRKFSVVVVAGLLLAITQSTFAAPKPPANSSAPSTVASVGGILPLTCAGNTARCLYGYVYYGGTPVSGASVRIDSLFGTTTITTTSGGLSASPYFQSSLSDAPLLASAGDTITLTASYNGSSATTVYVVAPGGQQGDVVIPISPLSGNGSDGDLTVTGLVDVNPVRAIVSGTAGSNVLTISGVTGSGFQPNQMVLIHQSRGTNAGVWEQRTIQLVGTTQLTLTAPLSNTYTTDSGASRAQALWVPQYRNLTINAGGTIEPAGWHGNVGGISAFLASGTVTINGTISLLGRGYRGPIFGTSPGSEGTQGEGEVGDGSYNSQSANGGGGGGGQSYSSPNGASGGGGGSHATAGTSGGAGAGSGRTPGAAGNLSNDLPDLTRALFGGAGGTGGNQGGLTDTPDSGKGGGFIFISASTVVVTGSGNISADGGPANGGPHDQSGGQAGGAGGSVLLKSQTINLGTNLVTALVHPGLNGPNV